MGLHVVEKARVYRTCIVLQSFYMEVGMSQSCDFVVPSGVRIVMPLCGAPGSGKSVIGKRLVKRFGAKRIVCSEQIEIGINEGIFSHSTDVDERRLEVELMLGHMRRLKAAGVFIPDPIVNSCITAAMKRTEAQFIVLDGYPRTAAQVEVLYATCLSTFSHFVLAPLVIEASPAYCGNNIARRANEEGRADDADALVYMSRIYRYLEHFGNPKDQHLKDLAAVLSFRSSLRHVPGFPHGFVIMEKNDDELQPISEVEAETDRLMYSVIQAVNASKQ